jgi:hypothetical protein
MSIYVFRKLNKEYHPLALLSMVIKRPFASKYSLSLPNKHLLRKAVERIVDKEKKLLDKGK